MPSGAEPLMTNLITSITPVPPRSKIRDRSTVCSTELCAWWFRASHSPSMVWLSPSFSHVCAAFLCVLLPMRHDITIYDNDRVVAVENDSKQATKLTVRVQLSCRLDTRRHMRCFSRDFRLDLLSQALFFIRQVVSENERDLFKRFLRCFRDK